jgi:type 1 glutamine amidotransferase
MNVLPIIGLALLTVTPPAPEPARPLVLVYTRTLGYRHDAIPAGIAAVRELGAEGGFTVDATEDAAAFTPANLGRYRAIVFLNTSGEVLDERQKAAFQDYIERGGGLTAVHQGITTLDKWPWYVDLVGGVRFAGHPQVQPATCRCEIRDHPATESLPNPWPWTDEWYNFDRNPRDRVHVLMTVDEASYQGGKMGKDHPISWYRETGKGRVWCTGLGHTKEGYGRPPFRQHLLGGIRWAAGLTAAGAKADQAVPARDAATGNPALRSATPRAAAVRTSDVTLYGDLDCYKVETPTATYLYGKRGAGFVSILDKDGHDWVSYRPGDKARGEYRGLPKCGQPTKFFHGGYGYGQYKNDNPFTSRITVRDAHHARIESETRDGRSACAWDFYPEHATLTLTRIGQPTYWFLYEGTPGGRLDAKEDFVIRPDGSKTTLDEPWSKVVRWVCFGAAETPTGFVLVNHHEPEPGEVDSYVSWPFQRGSDGSYQDMTVFGFGRKGRKELIEHIPDLKRLPARYSIGFVDRADFATARAACEQLLASGTRSDPTASLGIVGQAWTDSDDRHTMEDHERTNRLSTHERDGRALSHPGARRGRDAAGS